MPQVTKLPDQARGILPLLRWPDRDLLRYAGVTSGPFGAAGVQFLLSLILLRVVDPASFGAFSLLFLLSQFLLLLWSALFCAPIVLALTGREGPNQPAIDAILAANMAGAAVCGIAMLGAAIWLGISPAAATGFALYTVLSLPRWLGRSISYARNAVIRVMLSDHGYTVVLLLATLWIALSPDRALEKACLGLAVAMLFALAGLGRGFAWMQLGALRLRGAVRRYRTIWRTQASASLGGVAAAEFLANNQALVVTAMLGPSAYAPLAACFLLVRPIPIALTALTEYERARMASALQRNADGELRSSLRGFSLMMLAVWAATCLFALVLLGTAPGLVFPPSQYALPTLVSGTILWVAVVLPRCLRAPPATALQAAGAFRPFANAGLLGSIVSLAAVTALLFLAPPVWTLLGTLAGEIAATLMIWRCFARWQRERNGGKRPRQ
jgi:hypothetical protein